MEGCFCKKGWVRDQFGICIPKENCHVDCPDHEVFSSCDKMCEKTCENQNPIFCPEICKPGCVCEPGWVRNENGICVRIEECPESKLL
jgi:hypothetical protein